LFNLIWRGENSLEQIEELERREREKERNYRIDIGAYGSICIEAPTKEECLELFREVTSTKREQRIDAAVFRRKILALERRFGAPYRNNTSLSI
jgi:hypothetical protein